MNETVRDHTREPGRFRNKLTGEEVLALQWRGWNHYPVIQFLDDALYTFDKDGNMRLYGDDGCLWVSPMDWIVKSETGVNPCSSAIFDQICEELL